MSANQADEVTLCHALDVNGRLVLNVGLSTFQHHLFYSAFGHYHPQVWGNKQNTLLRVLFRNRETRSILRQTR